MKYPAQYLPATIHWEGAGVYEPTIVGMSAHWHRNDVDPLVGVYIGSVAAAYRMGNVIQMVKEAA